MRTLKLLFLLLILSEVLIAQHLPVAGDTLFVDSLSIAFFEPRLSAGDYRAEMPPTVPMTPNASALVQYADYPVSHYTGVPDINIPLYNIVVDGYTLPLSLSYHASGIKVAQEASWVGLGWSLQAGGVISRTVKCYDDFLEYGHPTLPVEQGYYTGPEITDGTDSGYYVLMWNGSQYINVLVIDSEPDVFYYSLPGASGKFLLDKSRGAVLFDKKVNIKVDVLHNSTYGYHFQITTPDGVKYLFRTKEITEAYSNEGALNGNTTNILDDNPSDYLANPVKYTSSWYLTEITTPNKRKITFTYEQESYRSPTQESCIRYNYISHSGNFSCGITPSNNYYSRSKTVHQSVRLSGITWDNGRAEFTASNRSDLKEDNPNSMPKKLDALRIYNSSGSVVRGYDFNYAYFNPSQSGTYEYLYKRLKLSQVVDYRDDAFRYEFNYFDGAMPVKNTRNTDYWGYYNGKTYGNAYYTAGYYGNTYYSGALKTPNLTYACIGTLQKIIHPTGGSTEFTYEMNEYPATSFVDANRYPYTATEVLRTYNHYTNNNAYPEIPTYDYKDLIFEDVTTLTYNGHVENLALSGRDPDYIYNNPTSYPLFRIHRTEPTHRLITEIGCPEVYGSVNWEASLPQKSFTLDPGTYRLEAFTPPRDVRLYIWANYDFTQEPQPEDLARGGGLRISRIQADDMTRNFTYTGGRLLVKPVTSYNVTINCIVSNQQSSFLYHVQLSESTVPLTTLSHGNAIGYDQVEEAVSTGRTTYYFRNTPETSQAASFPFAPTRTNFSNGQNTQVTYGNSSATVRTINNTFGSADSRTVKGFIYKTESNQAVDYSYAVSYYHLTATEVIQQESSSYPALVVRDQFAYNTYAQPVSDQTSMYGDGYEDRILYPSDFTDAVSVGMTAQYYIGVPVEKIRLQNDQVIYGRKTIYKDTLGMYLPRTISVIETTVGRPQSTYASYYVPKIHYDLHNGYGKPLQITDPETTTVYLWSYQGEYPVAEIKNATYAEVAAILGGSFADTLAAKASPATADMQRIASLRNSLSGAFISTYTYTVPYGIASMSDPRGFTTYYEYDDQGRLTETYFLEDGDTRVIGNYRYHYKDK
ncbi:MAG: SUKH-4 family immunity protein [Bacteroides sp.]|nr:SUKH-4 family immunity protein [Bacteroides sp.]